MSGSLRQVAALITDVTNMDAEGEDSLRQKTTGVICESAAAPMRQHALSASLSSRAKATGIIMCVKGGAKAGIRCHLRESTRRQVPS